MLGIKQRKLNVNSIRTDIHEIGKLFPVRFLIIKNSIDKTRELTGNFKCDWEMIRRQKILRTVLFDHTRIVNAVNVFTDDKINNGGTTVVYWEKRGTIWWVYRNFSWTGQIPSSLSQNCSMLSFKVSSNDDRALKRKGFNEERLSLNSWNFGRTVQNWDGERVNGICDIQRQLFEWGIKDLIKMATPPYNLSIL